MEKILKEDVSEIHIILKGLINFTQLTTMLGLSQIKLFDWLNLYPKMP